MPGTAFSFREVREIWNKQMQTQNPNFSPAHSAVLSTNFRSAAHIVKCGNLLIDVMHRHFPNSIDFIQEQALFKAVDGRRPVIIHAPPLSSGPAAPVSLSTIYETVLMGSGQPKLRSLRHLDLVVIVRTEAGRARLRQTFVDATIVTVMEAKGLLAA